jgi:hypothetical protein
VSRMEQTRPISGVSDIKLEVAKPLILPVLLARFAGRIAFIAPGGQTFRPWLQRRRGVVIGRNVWIGQFVYIDEIHPTDVTIGDNCTIGLSFIRDPEDRPVTEKLLLKMTYLSVRTASSCRMYESAKGR